MRTYTLMVLRIAGLGLRFFLVIACAKFLSAEELGVFGLISGAVAAAPAVLGLGLHYFFNREISRLDHETAEIYLWARVRISLYFAFILYTCCSLVLFIFDVKFFWFLVVFVVLMEGASNDLYLGWVARGSSIKSAWFFFIRTAAWIPFYGVLASFFPIMQSINYLIFFWISGIIVSWIWVLRIFRGSELYFFDDILPDSKFLKIFGSWRLAAIVLASDIGIVSVAYFDRAIVAGGAGLALVGYYTFFWNFSNGVQQLILSSVVQLATPEMVRAASSSDGGECVKNILKLLLRRCLLWWVFLSFAALGLVWLLVFFYFDISFIKYFGLLPLFLVNVLVKIISDSVNYSIYAMAHDRALMLINVSGIFVGSLCLLLGVHLYGVWGAAIGCIVAQLLICIFRIYFFEGVINRQFSIKY